MTPKAVSILEESGISRKFSRRDKIVIGILIVLTGIGYVAKWLHKQGVNCMAMSPGKKDYSHVNCPLERIETAIEWLKEHGNKKIGIMGMSTAGMHALVAASYFPDITLTFGITASDFVWQGFEQGKKDGYKEWPIPNASTLSWKGEPLPYMPFVYKHPEY